MKCSNVFILTMAVLLVGGVAASQDVPDPLYVYTSDPSVGQITQIDVATGDSFLVFDDPSFVSFLRSSKSPLSAGKTATTHAPGNAPTCACRNVRGAPIQTAIRVVWRPARLIVGMHAKACPIVMTLEFRP